LGYAIATEPLVDWQARIRSRPETALYPLHSFLDTYDAARLDSIAHIQIDRANTLSGLEPLRPDLLRTPAGEDILVELVRRMIADGALRRPALHAWAVYRWRGSSAELRDRFASAARACPWLAADAEPVDFASVGGARTRAEVAAAAAEPLRTGALRVRLFSDCAMVAVTWLQPVPIPDGETALIDNPLGGPQDTCMASDRLRPVLRSWAADSLAVQLGAERSQRLARAAAEHGVALATVVHTALVAILAGRALPRAGAQLRVDHMVAQSAPWACLTQGPVSVSAALDGPATWLGSSGQGGDAPGSTAPQAPRGRAYQLAFWPASAEVVHTPASAAQLYGELRVDVIEAGDGQLDAIWQYSSELFERATVAKLAASWSDWLDTWMNDPGPPAWPAQDPPEHAPSWIHDYPVDPDQVSEHLRRDPAIADGTVIVRSSERGQPVCIAYVAAEPGALGPSPQGQELRDRIRARLPDYLRPDQFVAVPDLPRRGGMIDVAQLPSPRREPATDTERALVALWQEVLGREATAVTASFRSLGGDSLAALKLSAAIQRQFDRQLLITDLYQLQTIEQVARELDRAPESDPAGPDEP
ncbi:MAG: phosphopantetheine-binding protein, partial [Myxococcota bacterium]